MVLTAIIASALLSVQMEEEWKKSFDVNKSELVSAGINRYFPLTPGLTLELRGGDTALTVTVTHQTEKVDGVVTRIVEEREFEDGKLIEVSRNFFAIHPKTHDVYYFGEDVDMYRNGKIINHEGAWRSGLSGAKFGLMMPGDPKPGFAFYQEVAPRIAMDRAKIIATDSKVQTPFGVFENCLKSEETTPLEPRAIEYKYYARGVGLIQDADLKLAKRSINPRKE